MSDYLLELAQNQKARKFMQALGIPLPLPVRVKRPAGAWNERLLEGSDIVVGGIENGHLGQTIRRALAPVGAQAWLVGSERAAAAYRQAEAWVHAPEVLPPVAPDLGLRADALVFDASGLKTADSLRALFDFFQGWSSQLKDGGNVVILARPPETGELGQAAARAAVEGFCRSLGKEIGRRGAHANVVYIENGAEARAENVVRFLLSPYAAFITCQALHVTQFVRSNPSAGLARGLAGKVALVTGAGRGIGASTALALAREGAEVVGVDRPGQEAAVEEVARRTGGSSVVCDITDASAAQRLVKVLRERHGGVDIVVHNAGITRDKTLARMKPDAWETTLRVNLSAVVRITEAILEEELLRDNGRVIVLSSVSGIAGNAGQTNYAAAKAGLIGFTRSLAQRVAARGVTVNAVAPGFIETAMTERMPSALRQLARRMSALGQGGLPEDVAESITFLSLPASDGLSGSVLRVCGGSLLGA